MPPPRPTSAPQDMDDLDEVEQEFDGEDDDGHDEL